MKKLFSVSIILLLSISVIGQARDGTSAYSNNNQEVTVVALDLPYAPDVVVQAFKTYLLQTTARQQKNARGYLLSNNTALAKSNQDYDMIFEVAAKSRLQPNESIVYFKLNKTLLNKDEPGSLLIQYNKEEALSYLNNLAVAIKADAPLMQLNFQKETLEKALRNNEELMRRGVKLQEIKTNLATRLSLVNTSRMNAILLNRQLTNNENIATNLAALKQGLKDIGEQRLALTALELQH